MNESESLGKAILTIEDEIRLAENRGAPIKSLWKNLEALKPQLRATLSARRVAEAKCSPSRGLSTLDEHGTDSPYRGRRS